MTVRLSIRSFAGMARTDVAVGTVSDASMLCTTRAPTPRIGSTLAAAGVTTSLTGCATGSAGVGAEVTRGCETVGWEVKVVAAGVATGGVAAVATAGAGVATGVEGTAGVGVATVGVGVATGVATGTAGEACADAAARACAFGCGGTPPRGPFGDGGFAALPLGVMEVAAEGAKFDALNSGELKNSRQLASTESGSATYFSYISSTSQSLAPKFPLTEGKPIGGLA